MNIQTKQEILEILRMPAEEYKENIAPFARSLYIEKNGNALLATAMLGFDNICKNMCLYCGMRAANKDIKRYRLDREDVIAAANAAKDLGFNRIFLISGEDPGYGFANLIYIVRNIKEMGFHISLACGEFSKAQYKELRDAGADEYALKFEMAQEEVFNRLNPSTCFSKRMQAIEWVKESGMALASGNIVDYPGQTQEQLAEDILLTKELGISWAPIIPYMPAKGTPMALSGHRGSIEKNLKEISILRIMMPNINITAQQPGEDLSKGLSDPKGNLDALLAGGNILFADMLPSALAKDFSVVDNRIALGLGHIRNMAKLSEMNLV